jgi:transcriptional regulator with XRE-family HTH domain
MAGRHETNAAGHFGRQVRKERLAHGWSITELARRISVDAAHLGRIESGRRPPTEAIAAKCDEAFPGRRGWFTEWYQESRTWAEIPAGFRDWAELEDKAATVRTWTPGIIDGLAQAEDYARALISVQPAVTAEVTATRLANRMERQRRVLLRNSPPRTWFLVDEFALYRMVGSAEIMAEQMGHLLEVAAMPSVTMQVLPPIAHPANASGFVIADDAAWCEHMAGGYVFTGTETVSSLAVRFDSLRGECYRVSESAAMIARTGELWTRGVHPATQMAMAASA